MIRWRNLAVLLLTLGALGGCAGQAPPTAAGGASGEPTECRFPEPMTSLLKSHPDRAVAACRHLAEQGDPAGEARLGFLYQAGLGLPQDYAAAAGWYRMAAGQGNAAAQNNLALLYQNGQGVPVDLVQALAWFDLAAVQGGDAARNRDALAARMTKAQVAEAEALSRTLLPPPGP